MAAPNLPWMARVRRWASVALLLAAACGSEGGVWLSHARVVESADPLADARSAAAATVAALEGASQATGRGDTEGAAQAAVDAAETSLDDASARLDEVNARIQALNAERQALLARPDAGPEVSRNLARLVSEITRQGVLRREIEVHRRGKAAADLARDPTRAPTLAEAKAALTALERQAPGAPTSEVLGVTDAPVTVGAPATVEIDGVAHSGVVGRVEGAAVTVTVEARLRVGDRAEVRVGP